MDKKTKPVALPLPSGTSPALVGRTQPHTLRGGSGVEATEDIGKGPCISTSLGTGGRSHVAGQQLDRMDDLGSNRPCLE